MATIIRSEHSGEGNKRVPKKSIFLVAINDFRQKPELFSNVSSCSSEHFKLRVKFAASLVRNLNTSLQLFYYVFTIVKVGHRVLDSGQTTDQNTPAVAFRTSLQARCNSM